MSVKTRAALIGVGGMARYHIREILKQQDTTEITVVCEPSQAAYAESAQVFVEAGLQPPPNEPDLGKLLARGPLPADEHDAGVYDPEPVLGLTVRCDVLQPVWLQHECFVLLP